MAEGALQRQPSQRYGVFGDIDRYAERKRDIRRVISFTSEANPLAQSLRSSLADQGSRWLKRETEFCGPGHHQLHLNLMMQNSTPPLLATPPRYLVEHDRCMILGISLLDYSTKYGEEFGLGGGSCERRSVQGFRVR